MMVYRKLPLTLIIQNHYQQHNKSYSLYKWYHDNHIIATIAQPYIAVHFQYCFLDQSGQFLGPPLLKTILLIQTQCTDWTVWSGMGIASTHFVKQSCTTRLLLYDRGTSRISIATDHLPRLSNWKRCHWDLDWCWWLRLMVEIVTAAVSERPDSLWQERASALRFKGPCNA